jgi:uncharacterized membrane protein YdcZ (DUF606 family)
VDFVPLLALPILIVKIIDFLRYANARDRNGVVTQLLAWIGGVLGIWLVARSSFGGAVPIAGTTLNRLNAEAVVFVGMSVGSFGSLAFMDFRKAVDNSNSASLPTLLPTPGRHRIRNDEVCR